MGLDRGGHRSVVRLGGCEHQGRRGTAGQARGSRGGSGAGPKPLRNRIPDAYSISQEFPGGSGLIHSSKL